MSFCIVTYCVFTDQRKVHVANLTLDEAEKILASFDPEHREPLQSAPAVESL